MPHLQNLQKIQEANFEVSEQISNYHFASDTAKRKKSVEDWHAKYKTDKVAFAKLISMELKLERMLKVYFKEQEARIIPFIEWWKYNGELMKASEVTLTDAVDWEGELIKLAVIFNVTEDAFDAGIEAAQQMLGKPMALTVQDASFQTAFKKYGLSKAKGITETTKNNIKAKLSTALAQNMDANQAAQLLIDKKVINNPFRAETIARTEIVSARGAGVSATGQRLGAKGKQWFAAPSACALCEMNEQQGEIPFDSPFESGAMEPAAHPRCRCYMELTL